MLFGGRLGHDAVEWHEARSLRTPSTNGKK
jgi:hypothetical protein